MRLFTGFVQFEGVFSKWGHFCPRPVWRGLGTRSPDPWIPLYKEGIGIGTQIHGSGVPGPQIHGFPYNKEGIQVPGPIPGGSKMTHF